MKFAAIDIGSNAVRLLFKNVFRHKEKTIFQKDSLIRVPIRLGEEAFLDGVISERKAEKILKTMYAFRELLEVHEVLDYRACATSAMREAANGQEIAEQVREETGIDIKIIEGKYEAEVIHATEVSNEMDAEKAYLYIDVGGGSTELSLFSKGVFVDSYSFRIGTLRLLNNLVEDEMWLEMKEWLKQFKSDYPGIIAIGSGGNINKINKMYGKRKDNLLSLTTLKAVYNHLTSYSIIERIKELGLKPDRADVIVPASEIYISTMKWAGIKKIYVPQVGLSDGLIKKMYDQYAAEKRRETKSMAG